MMEQADSVAREFLAEHMKKAKDIHRAILRLAILDCFFNGPETDFIKKIVVHPTYSAKAKKVLALAEPFLVDLAGQTYIRMKGARK